MADKQKRRLEVVVPITPKTYDIDIADHVNNIVIVRWMEDLRFAWLAEYFPLEPLLEQKTAPVILETTVRYKNAIRLFDPVEGRIWVADMKGIRATLAFEFSVNGTTAVEAEQLTAWIQVPEGKPVRVPEGLRVLWEQV